MMQQDLYEEGVKDRYFLYFFPREHFFSFCLLLRSASVPNTLAQNQWSSPRECSHDNVTQTESCKTLK